MKSERGNIIVYLLIGLVLFGVLLGGVWWVKNRVANKPTPVATTQEQEPVKPGTDTKVDQDSKPETTDQTKEAEQAAPAAPAQPSAPENSTTNNTTGNANSTPSTTAPSGSSSAQANDVAALPPESRTASAGPSPTNVAASGPLENAIGTSLGLGIITFLASSFVLSRKSVH